MDFVPLEKPQMPQEIKDIIEQNNKILEINQAIIQAWGRPSYFVKADENQTHKR